jgi:DNA modification methylase
MKTVNFPYGDKSYASTLIYGQDNRVSMKGMPDKSVQCVVTSPPYWGLRDYGVEGQLGMEDTPEQFVANLVEVFREVRRVLRDDGTLWLNLGDSYAAQSSGLPAGIKHKDLVGIPWMTAFALRADGWYLRQDIIWAKKHTMPESVEDRCTKSHEYLFLLSKSPDYYFDHEAIKEPSITYTASVTINPEDNKGNIKGNMSEKGVTRTTEGLKHRQSNNPMRNKRSVWVVGPAPYRGSHFATFPPKLIEPCILAGSRIGDTVMDPFSGSGTTGYVSNRNQRNYVGLDVNEKYLPLAEARILGRDPPGDDDDDTSSVLDLF